MLDGFDSNEHKINVIQIKPHLKQKFLCFKVIYNNGSHSIDTILCSLKLKIYTVVRNLLRNHHIFFKQSNRN